MDNEALTNLLTGAAVPVLGLLATLFYWAMNRSDARRTAEEAEKAKEKAAADAIEKELYAVKAKVPGLVSRCIRRFEGIKSKAEQNKVPEVIAMAETAIRELEDYQI